MYTEQQMKKYARQQREICSLEANLWSYDKFNIVRNNSQRNHFDNTPSPPLPEKEQSDAGIVCPFCGADEGFDKVGLKWHLCVDCEAYERTSNV